MSSVSINGGKYLPENFKKIDLQGKDIETFLKENQNSIKTNFKDEIYVADGKDLYVAEFKNFPQSDIKKDKISFVDMPEAQIKLVDDEADKHTVAKVTITGVKDKDLEKFINKTMDIDKGDKVTLDDIIGKLRELQDKGKDKFINLSVMPVPAAGGKNGEVELVVKAVENPKTVKFHGVSADDAKKLQELFKGPLTKDNLTAAIDKVSDFYKNHPTKMLIAPVGDILDKEGTVHLDIKTMDLPVKANIRIAEPNAEGQLQNYSITKEDNEVIEKSFPKPLNPENVEKGMKNLSEHFSKKGMMIVNPNLSVNPDSGELNISFIKVKAPTKVSVTGMEVFDADDIKKHFKTPITKQSINEGIDAVKKMYTDAGYVFTDHKKNEVASEAERAKIPEGVEVDTNGEELRIKINLLKFDGFTVYGNSDTKEKTITRELSNVKQGRPVNIKELDEGVDRVRKTGLFKNAGYILEPGKDGKAKVNLVVQEQKNNEFSVFGGYSAGGGLFGGGSVTFGNLGGEGKTLSLKGEAGTKRFGGSVAYSDPWAFGDKVGVNSSLYAYKWEGPKVDEFRVGNSTNFNIPLGKDYLNSKWSLTPGLRSEYIGIDPKFSSSGTGHDWLVMPKLGINYSNVDNPGSPREGTKFGASIGLGTGSATFGQLDANVKHYIPLTENKKLTLSLGASGGAQVGNVPYYEEYNSFTTAPVYGRPSDGSERGNYFAVGSANLKYNVWGPFSLIAGATAGGIGPDHITDIGAGGGIEVDLMGIPLSVTAGARYNPVTNQKETAVNFNIFRVDF